MPSPLGRFLNQSPGHNKFWECLRSADGRYTTRWGAIGSRAQSKHGLSAAQAQFKIDEKCRNGYRHVPGSPTSLEEETARRLESVIPHPAAAAPPRRARL